MPCFKGFFWELSNSRDTVRVIKKKYGKTDSKAPSHWEDKAVRGSVPTASIPRTQVAWDTARTVLEFAHFRLDPYRKLFRQFNRVTIWLKPNEKRKQEERGKEAKDLGCGPREHPCSSCPAFVGPCGDFHCLQGTEENSECLLLKSVQNVSFIQNNIKVDKHESLETSGSVAATVLISRLFGLLYTALLCMKGI